MKVILSEYGRTIIAVITAGALIAMLVTGGYLAKALSDKADVGKDISYSESDEAFITDNGYYLETSEEYPEGD